MRRKGIQAGKESLGKRKGKTNEKEGKEEGKLRERKKKKRTANLWNLVAVSKAACGFAVACSFVAAREPASDFVVAHGLVVASKAPRLCAASEAACSHELSLVQL